ncbi:YuiB family protein [Halalkalibacter nanhaiisediminis]|uniref:YuiB-like putative membrane protein n=1 Tax=Halalkalibacter nanhaiisediminis TaxID=688079 RepID=A0A562Q857_9BACI|nr:YuiB family protein [Halalkalibacter nanhaiisediminis]TWI52919.1 YuiB-like putative membrane protein [Halalkalibacter nanhaiisediminis]
MFLPQLLISMILFLILFFGIGFLLNMVLRSTWIMAFFYPIVVILIVDEVGFFDYFTSPQTAFPMLGSDLLALQIVDILILSSGFIGTIIAGIVIKMLRVRGYQMF